MKPSALKDGRIVISISGEIVPGDSDGLKAAIKVANDAGKFVSSIRLNSPGGNLLEGAKIADAVRFAKMATNVGQGATCASACFLVFAAGETKFANYTAQIGVHGASDENGAETVQSNAATVSMAKMAKELGVPSAIIGRMVVTPPSEMVWLSPADLQSMGTTMVGKPIQLPVASAGPLAPQTQPGAPMQLQQATKASAPVSWKDFTNKAFELSRQQNGGTPKTLRSCQPEERTCATGVMFKLDGTDAIALTRENLDGKIVERELCTFNDFGDVRTCMDWDSKETHRDMKDTKGVWTKVSN
ncbi:ATP-dependent Clp protease proteolytic subunit [Bradyrhizobium sp. dw_411]|uniref:ATP-dependent Clp protease proteolytic subunit n=1 Tax=Bradyrhizobium sp. dw_411 TaxID=2720082 RepID=UPI001BCE0F2D|nr:ATP-dependent Clp protease proteolytic subunit [Bradyrhizobium sp. dw_411]